MKSCTVVLSSVCVQSMLIRLGEYVDRLLAGAIADNIILYIAMSIISIQVSNKKIVMNPESQIHVTTYSPHNYNSTIMKKTTTTRTYHKQTHNNIIYIVHK